MREDQWVGVHTVASQYLCLKAVANSTDNGVVVVRTMDQADTAAAYSQISTIDHHASRLHPVVDQEMVVAPSH